ncbi:hypothetical protein [[Eubacterium] cellulosolvens]
MPRLQRIILGNLPLVGISYQGMDKDREYKDKFSDKNEIKDILRVGLKYQIRNFSASSFNFNELAPLHLEAVKELEEEENIKIPLIACQGIPIEFQGQRINDYRRWATHLEYEMKEFGQEVRTRYLEDPILNFRNNWRENLSSAKPYDKKEINNNLRINWRQWEVNLQEFSDYEVEFMEPGSETDFLALCRIDLLGELVDRTRELGHRILFGSHHLGSTVSIIKGKIEHHDGYVTPVNKLGLMMFPLQKKVEEAIKEAKKDGKSIIAVKPFAGGRIEPKEALEYVFNKMRVDSCMIGVGSLEEAEFDIQIAEDTLKTVK